jgi:hypothetical protein
MDICCKYFTLCYTGAPCEVFEDRFAILLTLL